METQMAGGKADVLMIEAIMPLVDEGIEARFTLHRLWEAKDPNALIARLAPSLRYIVAGGSFHRKVGADLMAKLPELEFISSFGVGYDHVDARWAGEHGIVVTNTPDVLTEEVADTALGLLLCTVRQLSQAERYLRAGKWREADFPLSASLRDRTVGIVGLGRIGKAIARRLDAFGVPVVYHGRHQQAGVAYRYYASLIDMARDVDILMLVMPGGAATRAMVNAEVLEALGPDGILINMSRGSTVDEAALSDALKNRRILSAGLDVFWHEPEVPPQLLEMDHVTLLPHVGSASEHTRNAMGQLVVDNLVAWTSGKPPLTPVPETPVPEDRGQRSDVRGQR
jgi:lactate dehydrogenase-like 2-hydroxyacid dehydrogenase